MLKKVQPPRSRTCNRRINRRFLKAEVFLIALLSFMLMSSLAFGQGANASLSGTIADVSQAVLPGADVTVANVDTGVENRTTSNDRGVYNFGSLQPGTYTLTVDAPGFTRAVRTNIRLTVGGQASLNVEMAVAGTVTEVSVSGTVESVILDAGSSTGTVFQAESLMEIPLIGSNIMEVLNVMAGVVPTGDPINNPAGQTFAGVSGGSINLTRDGMSINEVRWGSGITGNTTMNQEMIGEFKMVLSAVDAEMGRGAGQVQTTTRSGSNAFHGSGVWNIQNTSLDAREFERKKRGDPPNWRNLNDYIISVSGPIIKNKTFFFASWERQYNLEKQNINARVLTPCARKGIYRYLGGINHIPDPTDPKKVITVNDGWIPQNLTETPIFSGERSRPSVKADGTPLTGSTQLFNPGTVQMETYNSELYFESIFGELTPDNRRLLADASNPGSAYGDCSSLVFDGPSGNYGVIGNTYWGTGIYARAWDTSGYVHNIINGVSYSAGTVQMPPVNNWDIGDGLNTAGHRWVYGPRGITTIYGTGGDVERKAVNLKIDHNINNDHRLSGTWTWQQEDGDMAQQQWPSEYGGYAGVNSRYPQNFMGSLTSTLRPTLLNEARFGYVSQNSYTQDAMHGKYGEEMESVLRSLMPTGAGSQFAGTSYQDRIILTFVGNGMTAFSSDNSPTSHPYSVRDGIGTAATWGGKDYRLTFADTVTWMKGTHSFKAGAEYRYQQSYQDYTGVRAFIGTGALIRDPSIYGGRTAATNTRRQDFRPLGAANAACLAADGTGSWCGVMNGSTDGSSLSGNYTTAYQMMDFFSGSITRMSQYFYLAPEDNDWNDVTKGQELQAYQIMNKEISFFFKDDWKLTPDLTLNLGVRYEYYGVPYNWNGYTPALRGGASTNVFGLSKDLGWDRWMNGRDSGYVYDDPGPISVFEYVGPGSPNSDRGAWNPDKNNFGPHVGFAWQLPWLGKGFTTLRGGYSLSYSPVDVFDQYGIRVADVSGTGQSYSFSYAGSGSQSYTGSGPGGVMGPNDHGYDSAYYMDFSDLPRILPLKDTIPAHIKPMTVRQNGQFYSGLTSTDENVRNPMIHSVNLSLTRNIGRALTLDVRYVGTLSRKQVVSTNINAVDYISNGLYLELDKVRRGEQSALINSLIPRGVLTSINGAITGSDQLRNWNTTAANLARGNFQGVASTLSTTNGALTTTDPLANGMVLRSGCLPQDRTIPGDYTTNCTRNTPWNYFTSNSQYSGPSIYYNGALSNYHSMQAQATLRPTRGLSFQVTYTWSRSLSNSGWTNYTGDRFEDRDYQLTGSHRSHALNTYGTWELPFGPNGFFFRDATGVFKKAVEGWQLSWITAMSSGGPMSIAGNNTMWSDSSPILVRPDLWDNKAGKAEVMWTDDGKYIGGRYFGERYTTYALDTHLCDSTVDSSLYSQYCSNSKTGLPIPATGAPRVLALASGQSVGGNLLPAVYEQDTMGADGILYKAGEPIVVIRQADQRLGANAAGNFRPNSLTGVGRLSFDLAMAKSVEFMEGKRLEIRVDAQNILNHATPSNTYSTYAPSMRNVAVTDPSIALSSTNFGYILTKVGRRTFQAKLRLSF